VRRIAALKVAVFVGLFACLAQIVDVVSAKIVETIVSPQAILNSLTFSPDGKLLASSGHGEVLLWDFSTPPGHKPAEQ
jgi:WD40 repeat protein